MKDVTGRLLAADRLLLLLDFDGTLAQIVPDPREARLPERARAALEKLNANGRDRVAILSGRLLDDVRARVGLGNLIYAGNHGLEIAAPEFERTHPGADRLRPLVRAICADLEQRLSAAPGVVVECKDLTISVHYRLAAEDCVDEIGRIVAASAGELDVGAGRKVFELRPRDGWNKGDAARYIRRQTGGLPVAIGDDRTDEDIFAAVADGVTIHAGELPRTRAAYRLGGPGAVADFLERLASGRESSHE